MEENVKEEQLEGSSSSIIVENGIKMNEIITEIQKVMNPSMVETSEGIKIGMDIAKTFISEKIAEISIEEISIEELKTNVEERLKIFIEEAKSHLNQQEIEIFIAETREKLQLVFESKNEEKEKIIEAAKKCQEILIEKVSQINTIAIKTEIQKKIEFAIEQGKKYLNEEQVKQLRDQLKLKVEEWIKATQGMNKTEIMKAASSFLIRTAFEINKKIDIEDVKRVVEMKLIILFKDVKKYIPEQQLLLIIDKAKEKLNEIIDKHGYTSTKEELVEKVIGAITLMVEESKKKFSEFRDIIMEKKEQFIKKKEEVIKQFDKHKPVANLIKDILIENTFELKTTMTEILQEEFLQMLKSVHYVLKNESSSSFSGEQTIHQIASGLIAPLRLKLTYWTTHFSIIHSFIIILLCAICLLIDRKTSCEISYSRLTLTGYFVVYIAVYIAKFIARLFVYLRLKHFWSQYSLGAILVSGKSVDSLDNPSQDEIDINPQGMVHEMLSDVAEIGEASVVVKSDLDSSQASRILVILQIALTCWRCLGFQFWIDVRCGICDQYNLIWLLVLTNFEFFFCLTYHVVYIIIFIIMFYVNIFAKKEIIKKAQEFDKKHFGFPALELVIVHFVLAKPLHTREIIKKHNERKKNVLLHEKEMLQHELKELRRKLGNCQMQLKRMNEDSKNFVVENDSKLNVPLRRKSTMNRRSQESAHNEVKQPQQPQQQQQQQASSSHP